jgi:threonine/homoserine/homoserine lactone efflux protein
VYDDGGEGGGVSELGAFVGVSLLVIVTPGPDTALTIRSALAGGRREGVRTALGVTCGQAVWTLATSAGVAAVLVASEPAFVTLKLAGAAYLCFLGAGALRSALAAAPREEGAGSPLGGRIAWASTPFRQGLISNLANPKMAAFFPSLLPQFAGDGGGAFAEMALLGALFCSLTLCWLSLYAIAVARAGALLRRGPVRRLFEGAMGLALVGLGVRLAATQR